MSEFRYIGAGIVMEDLRRFQRHEFPVNPVRDAAAKIGATPAGIPGLWNAPGYPELTTGQLLQIAGGQS